MCPSCLPKVGRADRKKTVGLVRHLSFFVNQQWVRWKSSLKLFLNKAILLHLFFKKKLCVYVYVHTHSVVYVCIRYTQLFKK